MKGFHLIPTIIVTGKKVLLSPFICKEMKTQVQKFPDFTVIQSNPDFVFDPGAPSTLYQFLPIKHEQNTVGEEGHLKVCLNLLAPDVWRTARWAGGWTR